VRKALALSAAITLTFAAAALAAGPTIKVTVTPDTPSAHSTLKLSATGPYSQSGLPKSLEMTAQKGFQSSAKSVPILCNSKSSKVTSNSANPCPAKSKVGSGKVVANVTSPPLGQQTVPFTLYLGKPRRTGDIASIVLSADVPIAGTQNVVGRLFKAGNGSIEILFNKLPSASGVTVKVKNLNFSAHAVNGGHSLITNPPSCNKGHWTGTFTLTFASGTLSKHTSIPCSK
jgi:hypothetical protein